ncbi:hypothetical protein WR25_10520 [Diploscapter pachys]|uniref:Uncharacterized protein n=1 Tax=Diploscapter pachys TaxID=2018661 RepID=A0A2A2JYE5_9BILA|nr:hypothetical protein WR25_10520 [Diploscapter pachys]
MSVENVKSAEDCKAFALNSVTKLAATMAVKLKEMGISDATEMASEYETIAKRKINEIFVESQVAEKVEELKTLEEKARTRGDVVGFRVTDPMMQLKAHAQVEWEHHEEELRRHIARLEREREEKQAMLVDRRLEFKRLEKSVGDKLADLQKQGKRPTKLNAKYKNASNPAWSISRFGSSSNQLPNSLIIMKLLLLAGLCIAFAAAMPVDELLRQEVVELAHDDFEPLELTDSSSSDEDDSSEELAVLEMNEVGAPEMMNLQEVAPGGTWIPPDVRSRREEKRRENRRKRAEKARGKGRKRTTGGKGGKRTTGGKGGKPLQN